MFLSCKDLASIHNADTHTEYDDLSYLKYMTRLHCICVTLCVCQEKRATFRVIYISRVSKENVEMNLLDGIDDVMVKTHFFFGI